MADFRSSSGRRWTLLPLIGLAFSAVAAPRAWAQYNSGEDPPELQGVDVIEKLNVQLPLDDEFIDDQGNRVRLGQYFDGKHPVLITLNYLSCPMLCTLQLNGLIDTLKEMEWTPGNEFRVLTISFDPLERYDLSNDNAERVRAKKRNYLSEYGRSQAAAGWHFLTGTRDNIKKLTETVGFHYKWSEEQNQWAHKATLLVVTPAGRVSRYLGGIHFDPQTLRLSMVEASAGKVGSLWDQVFLSCFHYVPSDGKYVPMAMNVMRLAGGATVLVLGVTILSLWRFEVRRRRRAQAAAGVPSVQGMGVAH